MTFKKLGVVALNTQNGVQEFDVQPVCSQHYRTGSGYVMVDGVPITSVSLERTSLNVPFSLCEGAIERAQLAYDSYIENDGEYNADMLLEPSDVEQVLSLSPEILKYATADSYDFLGTKMLFVENTSNSPVAFRFYVRNRGLMKTIFEQVIKPKMTRKESFQDYTGFNY